MENHKDLVSKTIFEDKSIDLVVPYLDENIVFNMLMMLRAQKVHRMRYSCKQWLNLINTSRFIATHLRQSTPGFLAIPRSALLSRVRGFRYVDPVNIRIENVKDFTIGRLKLNCKKIVRSSCNGLVLLDDMPSVGRLIVANPVTNQLVELPPCTQWSERLDIIRGITFLDSTGEYKVVSLVINEAGFMRCEVLALGSTFHKWDWVNSPFRRLFDCFVIKYGSIIIKGVLHFILGATYENDSIMSVYMVSFDALDEKFYKSKVPAACLSRVDVLHEIEGFPSLIVPNKQEAQSLELCLWDIWVVKDLSSGEWQKLYSVNLIVYGNKFPQKWHHSDVLATFVNGRFFILRGSKNCLNDYYLYDVHLQQLTSLKLKSQVEYAFLPHVESLVPYPSS